MSPNRVILAIVLVISTAACNADATRAPASLVAEVSLAPTVSLTPEPSPSTQTPSPTPTAVPTAIPTPTPIPTPVPWQSYKSKRDHYSIEYPPGWVVTPGTGNLTDRFDNFGYPYLDINRDLDSRAISLGETASFEIAYFKSHYHAKLISTKAAKVAGYSGRLALFSGTDQGQKVIIQDLILVKGRAAYFLTMFGEPGTLDADRALFRKIYLTFKPT